MENKILLTVFLQLASTLSIFFKILIAGDQTIVINFEH